MQWADLIVEELVRSGVEVFAIAPGSRSTPLVAAVAAHPKARAVVHFDERGTAFFALGYGRATRRPAAWITTSGTALANGFPAIVEAATDGVPMLLLTADRPPELRQSGANQTIDQVKMFGGYVRWFFDLPAPTHDLPPAALLTTIDQAVYRARRTPAGPVHLNCMFREPLAPTPATEADEAWLSGMAAWRGGTAPFTRYTEGARQVDLPALERLAEALRGVRRGLVVAGPLQTPAEGAAVRRLAEHLGWPLLPDVGSQLRLGHGASGAIIPHGDLLLGSEGFATGHVPEAVLHLGGRPTSKRLGLWLARHRPQPYAVVHPGPERRDPHHHATHRLEADVAGFCAALAGQTEGASDDGWRAAWRRASSQAAGVLDDFMAEAEALSEPFVARAVSEHLPEGHALVLASSMPVRDVDMFARADGAAAFVAANRGASGIDGLVATAAGVAEGRHQPATLLIGDLALLHDLNALALLRERPVTVVAVNNDGGGIFHFLPIAGHEGLFERYFGTPHGFTFEHAAAMFGLAYHRAMSPDGFLDAYRSATAEAGPTLIEVATDRAVNRTLHEALLERIGAALEA